jgi:hypothetical protein
MKETYAIRVITPKPGDGPNFIYQASGRLRSFNTREEAQAYKDEMNRLPGHYYSVVYVREYFDRIMDEDGNFTRSSVAEIPENRG